MNRFVAIVVGVMKPEKLKTTISVNLTTEDIVGISNTATGKCKDDENYHNQHLLHPNLTFFHSWC